MNQPASSMVSIPIEQSAKLAREASRRLATLSTQQKNQLLMKLASAIETRVEAVLAANEADLGAAREGGLAASKVQRLSLDRAALGRMAEGLRQIAALPDPVGAVTSERVVANGLRVRKVRAPLGVIAMIYEARPGVTIDAFALCFKAGNACILKGGKEAAASNAALAAIVREVLLGADLPEAAITSVSAPTRDDLKELLELNQYIDLVIPRGGRELIEFVVGHSTIPTIQHFQGVCHIVIDETAEVGAAIEICATAKTSAPAACNAVECLLVHKNIADRFIPPMVERFAREGVEVRAGPRAHALCPEGVGKTVKLAQAEDFGHEFLDLIIAMRIVENIDEAIDHIATYGSNHTESILTEDAASALRFTTAVQSSCVMVNASTRFNDGFSLGLGAEIGISTSRIHAYGPMGLEELTTQRWIVEGSGHTR